MLNYELIELVCCLKQQCILRVFLKIVFS